MTTLMRWMLLVALLFSPLAMQPVTAGTATPAAMSEMAGHCDPAAPNEAHPVADCSMACSSALPAIDLPSLGQPDAPTIVASPSRVVRLDGAGPLSATPPPRVA